MQITHKTILLIGATGGIGAAIAKHLDQIDARLLLVGRNEQGLNALATTLKHEPVTVVADLNSFEGRRLIVEKSQHYMVDIVINAAGVMDFQLFEQQNSEKIQQMINTNLLAPMLLCQELIPLLKNKESAAIVNIGSIFGSIGHPGFSAYCASKFGLRGFTEALQRELSNTSISVLYLAPRATSTQLNSKAVTDLNAALGNSTDTPEQVAKELVLALTSKQRQRFMGWPEKLFVRLNALFPNIVHKALVKKLAIIRRYANENI